MAAFTDYAYYTMHGGQLDEATYLAVVDDAHAEILLQTNGRASAAPASMQDAVKVCECKLIDVIAAYKKSAALLPKGINSVNNDGYSISAGADLSQSEVREKQSVCARYLQQPVNLMCRWL
jgi:hypothetical protein